MSPLRECFPLQFIEVTETADVFRVSPRGPESKGNKLLATLGGILRNLTGTETAGCLLFYSCLLDGHLFDQFGHNHF